MVPEAELNPAILGDSGSISGRVAPGDEVVLFCPTGRLDTQVFILGAVLQQPPSDMVTAENPISRFGGIYDLYNLPGAVENLTGRFNPFSPDSAVDRPGVLTEKVDISPPDAAFIGGTEPQIFRTTEPGTGIEYQWEISAERIDITRFRPGDRNMLVGWRWVDWPFFDPDGARNIPGLGSSYFTGFGTFIHAAYAMDVATYTSAELGKTFSLAGLAGFASLLSFVDFIVVLVNDLPFELYSIPLRNAFHGHELNATGLTPFRLWYRED